MDAGLALRASGIEVVRFYGFGNETAALKVADYYRVHQTQYLIAPSLVARSRRVRLSIRRLAHAGSRQRWRWEAIRSMSLGSAGASRACTVFPSTDSPVTGRCTGTPSCGCPWR